MPDFRRRLPIVLALLVLSAVPACGPKETPPPAPRPASAPAVVNCVVEGTPFVPGRGVKVTIAGVDHEVCSHGCAIRLETTPDRFLRGPK